MLIDLFPGIAVVFRLSHFISCDSGWARGIANIPNSAAVSRRGKALRVTFLICSLTSAHSGEGASPPIVNHNQ